MGSWLIVRHGETEWNAGNRIQGHNDVPLSETGVRQSRMLAKRLSRFPIDLAYTSDLERCAGTARELLKGRATPLHATPQLRECHQGVFESLTVEETERRHPEQYAASLVNDLDFAPEGGESIRQTNARVASFVSDVRLRHAGENLLIVAHGGSIRAMFVALMELPLEANWRFALSNCGLSVVDIYPDNAVLQLCNDTSHLDDFAS